MYTVFVLLLTLQSPQKPESTLWTYKAGQEFYVEEGQRQFLQVKGLSEVNNYFDFTYLWRYLVQSEVNGELKIQATLEKVKVNNLNEAGGRASEELKLQEGSRSNWLLKKTGSAWSIRPAPDNTSKHAAPILLTLGSNKIDERIPGWKQSWSMPKSEWGQAQLELTMTIRQQTSDRVSINNKAQFTWQNNKNQPVAITVQPQTSTTVGLGEFDINKGRWLYFEWRAEGTWQITSANSSSTMKQSQYCYYRYSERRPTFP